MIETKKDQFEKWLNRLEDIDLEFKLASSNFDNSHGSLFDYCAAIANGKGGKLILGIQDNPRAVKGTGYAKGTHTRLSHMLWERLKIHIDVEEFFYDGKRILIFHIPKHSLSTRAKSGGKGDKYTYPIRRGESLGEMDDQKTREILNEAQADFSAQIVPNLTLTELDTEALLNFREKWSEKSKRADFLDFPFDKMLRSIGLLSDQGINYAGLILFGKKEKLDHFLPGSEVIFEWRQDPAKTSYDFRNNWRAPFFKIYDQIWEVISVRNLQYPFQDGLFQRAIPAFSEKTHPRSTLKCSCPPRLYY